MHWRPRNEYNAFRLGYACPACGGVWGACAVALAPSVADSGPSEILVDLPPTS